MRCFVDSRIDFFDAVSCIASSDLLCFERKTLRTSGGLYYFSAKLAPPSYAPLICWITGWANITGQVLLLSSIDLTTYVFD